MNHTRSELDERYAQICHDKECGYWGGTCKHHSRNNSEVICPVDEAARERDPNFFRCNIADNHKCPFLERDGTCGRGVWTDTRRLPCGG